MQAGYSISDNKARWKLTILDKTVVPQRSFFGQKQAVLSTIPLKLDTKP